MRIAAPQPVSTVHTALFAFGSARLTLADAEGRRLVDDARDAPLIELRGRTDGAGDSLVDSRIARQRAEAVGGFLVQSGIDPSRIRVTWQPYGDHVADNSLPGGRSLNRRVEIEIYRVQPQMAARGTSAAS